MNSESNIEIINKERFRIKMRDTDAFDKDKKDKKHKDFEGCSCKFSRCISMYCVCKKIGKECNPKAWA